ATTRAEFAQFEANRAAADLHAALDDALTEARENPDRWVDPAFQVKPTERAAFAERAAAADLAVRLSMSEGSVRARAFDGHTLRRLLPRLWQRFVDGEVSPANARCAAELARSLPEDCVAAFDETVAADAARLTPVRFRLRARAVRERLHSVSLTERSKAATETRGVWIENELDGMAVLSMRLPADAAHRGYAAIDGAARSLRDCGGEERTLDQFRADVAADLLTGSAGASRPNVSVAVTVPVLTLLGAGDEPATLDGYGPIDAETARRLAAHAPSFTRLLTHPISGGLLDIDRTSYRPPADLKRWLAVTDVLCAFPGCGRLARNSDIDHTVDHQYGGATRADNLAHLCRHHHRVKHQTRWRVRQGPDRKITWTSPTGHERDADPPPF
ncbi:MAG TPA: DUF222 domain-containing protein, partial [Pseudolysinimonas sp.]|nr:DUF222 domain-containing protein [Pseudolysinimonas sp.]